MIFNGREIAFPAIARIGFTKVFESLERLANDPDKRTADYAKNLIKLKEEYPLLEEGFEDFSLLKKYEKPIRQLTRILFPEVLSDNEIKAVMPPFSYQPFQVSRRFQKILDNAGQEFELQLKGYDEDSIYIYGCLGILKMYYNYPIDSNSRSLIEIPDKKNNMVRTYKMALNGDMIEMIPTEKSKKVTYEDYLELLDNYDNIELWKAKFPPNSWIMRGIGIANLMDITSDNSLNNITTNLINKTTSSIEKIQESLKILFNIKDLQIGLVDYENDQFMSIKKGNMTGVILKHDEKMNCTDTLCAFSYEQLINLRHPLIVPDVDKFESLSGSNLSKILKRKGLKSYIIAPLVHDENLLGFLELGSNTAYQLSNALLDKLNTILPILSIATNRFKTESRNRIEAIIQKECTTIHPSVKWRFEEEAKKYILREDQNDQASFRDIIFKDVIPLYGQLDIKDSSTKRNEAVKNDLLKQIHGVRQVIYTAFDKLKLPVYEELLFRVDKYKKELSGGLFAGSEHKILGFLRSEIYPLFEHFKGVNADLTYLVEEYMSMLDPELESVYEERKNFDESVTKINYSLATYLDEKQKEAQKMFPHYFERYKTDGVEYNMYIGQAISNTKKFDPIYLSNLLLWQLKTMCEMEIRFKKLQKELSTPLEIASLILVYGTPLAVHFRMDEKKFDVEGAYNARYEIVKKRIDKAKIKGTKERITSPGKIAVVYSKEQDAIEYRKHINFLQSKGYLKKGLIEDHELEDLQGISGLRALRMEVDYKNANKASKTFDFEEIMEAVEQHN